MAIDRDAEGDLEKPRARRATATAARCRANGQSAGRAADAAPASRSAAPRIERNLVSAARHVGHEVAGQHPGERRSRQSLGVAQGALENVRKSALQRLRLHLEGIWMFHAASLA